MPWRWTVRGFEWQLKRQRGNLFPRCSMRKILSSWGKPQSNFRSPAQINTSEKEFERKNPAHGCGAVVCIYSMVSNIECKTHLGEAMMHDQQQKKHNVVVGAKWKKSHYYIRSTIMQYCFLNKPLAAACRIGIYSRLISGKTIIIIILVSTMSSNWTTKHKHGDCIVITNKE